MLGSTLRRVLVPKTTQFARPMCQGSSVVVHNLIMPHISDFTNGDIDKWLVREGENFKKEDTLCHVTVSDMMVGVEAPQDGVIVRILYAEGEKDIPFDQPIAAFVSDEDYKVYATEELAKLRESVEESSTAELEVKTEKVLGTTDLLREIKILTNSGVIVDDSDFAKQISTLARRGNKELLAVFEASFDEGREGEQATFDSNFFMDNAREIVKDHYSIIG